MKTLFTFFSLIVLASNPTHKDGDVTQKLKDLIQAIEVKAEALRDDVKSSVKEKSDKIKDEIEDAQKKIGKTKDKALNKVAGEIHELEKEVRGLTKK